MSPEVDLTYILTSPAPSTDGVEGLVIGDKYKLEKWIRDENHARVYSVCHISSPQESYSSETLEARAYFNKDVSNALLKYRLRSIKRLASRTVLHARWESIDVVVYKVDETQDEAPQDTVSTKKAIRDEIQTKKSQEMKSKEKSDIQREKDRLRQSERRKNRRKEQRRKAGDVKNESYAVEEVTQSPTDEEDTLYILLHLAFNRRQELRQELPPPSRIQLENYLQKQPMQFQEVAEMESFMGIKLREVVFLGLQQKKLPDIEKRRKEEYADLLKQQTCLVKGSEAYNLIQEKAKMAQGRLRTIRHVQEVLPGVITDADKIYQDMKRAVKAARDLEEEGKGLQALSDEWHKLKRKLDFCKKISTEVVPGSEPYAHVVRQVQAAEEELKEFETGNGGLTINELDSSKDEVGILLGNLMKDLDINDVTGI